MEMKRQTTIFLTAAAILACYAPTLRGMFDQWWNDEDMGHGLLVPIVIVWIVGRERQHWQRLPLGPSSWGFAVLAAGAGIQAAALLGAGLFAGSVAFLATIAGAVLCLGGFRLLRAWAFPLSLALFMLPKLAIVYNQVTLPLQLLASRLAVAILSAGGVGVFREGNILDVGGHRVLVVEACNGIRYLLSLGFLAVFFAYVFDPKPWMRGVLLAAAIPVSIAANAVRVAAAAWLPALQVGASHAILGWFVFILSLTTLLCVRSLCNLAYVRYHA